MAFLALTALTGLAYPLLVAGLARTAFPIQAAGSLVAKDGRVVGSALIGQSFTDPGDFWGRPSATSGSDGKPRPYNAANSGASSLAASNPEFRKTVAARALDLQAADPTNLAPIPVDLVTASGSGLDPHISPAAAIYQVHRVAKARGIREAEVRALVRSHIERPQFGFLGNPRVNVLKLNLALDTIRPK